MNYRHAQRRHVLRLVMLDSIALALALAGAFWLRRTLPAETLYLPLDVYLPAALVLGLLVLVLANRQRLYLDLPDGPIGSELFAVATSVTLAVALFIAGAFWVRDLSLSRLFVGATWVLLLVLMALGRGIARGMRRGELKQGEGIRRVLLVGDAASVAVLRDSYGAAERAGQCTVATMPFAEFDQRLIATHAADEIVLHGEEASPGQIFVWGGLAARQGVALKVLPPGASLAALPLSFDPTSGIPLLEVGHGLLDPSAQLGKRLLDLVLLILCFVPGIVIGLGVMIAILLTSPGASPLFWHTRLGRGGRTLRVLKFRTMIPNAEAVLDADPEMRRRFEEEYKLDDDPRITRVGHFLRRTSLDELPQLWNILLGEMSFVGPRPIVPPELGKYGEYGDLLLSVPPGLTGLWQVSGRSAVTYEERIQLDMLYIQRWSLALDLRILFLTIPAVLGRRGAK